jgi:hypothetical protein
MLLYSINFVVMKNKYDLPDIRKQTYKTCLTKDPDSYLIVDIPLDLEISNMIISLGGTYDKDLSLREFLTEDYDRLGLDIDYYYFWSSTMAINFANYFLFSLKFEDESYNYDRIILNKLADDAGNFFYKQLID